VSLLGVYRDGVEVGRLERSDERPSEYAFRYVGRPRAISLSLPLQGEPFHAARSRPFFEGLLPEGAIRERLATRLKLAGGDSYGLLAKLGADCAGALQIAEDKRELGSPAVGWLGEGELDTLVQELPRHPLGMTTEDERLRLSLAGVQHKAVLVRDGAGRFGEPLDGMPSTHILKPEIPAGDYSGLARNECFCMRLAMRCGLPAARVELVRAAGRPCLVVERFDREPASEPGGPPRRRHQEDLCQALGLLPSFKYQREGWRVPSYGALAELLDAHSPQPGLDRLAGARAAVMNFLLGNADAHAKNISLLHTPEGARLAPLYDVVCTAAYPELDTELSLSVGDELNPEAITSIHWSDLAEDFGLQPRAFERERRRLVDLARAQASRLRAEAHTGGWHHPCIDTILDVIAERAERIV
jgi:serine/threonine-protein kinase HipA